jgi:hypothetical protein
MPAIVGTLKDMLVAAPRDRTVKASFLFLESWLDW